MAGRGEGREEGAPGRRRPWARALRTPWVAYRERQEQGRAPIHLVQATPGHASVTTTSTYLRARPTDGSPRYLAV
jgi:hypothetical protein